jgi:hypothetical protein
MSCFKNLVKTIFHKKILIYTALGQNEYFRIVNKLAGNGLKYSVKSPVNARGPNHFDNLYRQYDIYVLEEDEQKANEAIHKKD